MTEAEKLLFDEKFKGLASLINARMENLDDKLDQIHIEAKRTNGRISRLEDHREFVNHIIDTRAQDCPNLKLIKDQGEQITTIKNSLLEYTMILKYPKLFVGVLLLVLVLTLATFIEKNETIQKVLEKPKTEQVVPQANNPQ